MQRLIDFFVDNKLVAAVVCALLVTLGIYVMPFEVDTGGLPRDPVPVDAIPDIGENQQIVFTRWPGRSPQDVEDQISYPLTVSLLGLPGVKTIRSYSYFGYSSVYIVFQEDVEFYWSRSRVLEKLSSLPPGTLPVGVRPELGPDATALGQIFWYTLEAEGFDLHELRSIQDFYVRYALQSVEGVSEVASVGGFVREYQIDVDPDRLRAYGVTLPQVYKAVGEANVDVGARTIETNGVEYVVRGVGFVQSAADLSRTVVAERDHAPITLEQVARITLGPAMRRGALDKAGAEAVGGVAVVRFGENPLEVIRRVQAKVEEISPGLPTRTLADGTVSQVEIVPFYDRTTLINETLGTLRTALTDEILITIIVVIVMIWELRSSILISGLLPIAVLLSFAGMRLTGVDANVMSLAGIAIAIGTMVDMGIIVSENIVRHLGESDESEPVGTVVKRAVGEVASAVTTAVATTVVSFLPVFAMTGAEAKLFQPLAFTKTYALLASIFVALLLMPPFAAIAFRRRGGLADIEIVHRGISIVVAVLGIPALIQGWWWAGLLLIAVGVWREVRPHLSERAVTRVAAAANLTALTVVLVILAEHWAPLGHVAGLGLNLLFVTGTSVGLLLGFRLFIRGFEPMLRWCLAHKLLFSTLPVALLLFGAAVWLGARPLLGWLPDSLRLSGPVVALDHAFPGLGKEFMPPLDEGSYLLMPTTMPHASIGEALDVLQLQDRAVSNIPEVESVVGKIGRAESALDPAPVSMVETIINYKPEYGPPDPETGERERLWRDHIETPDDIWAEIVAAAEIPGTTSAPKLQPIAARIVMLQSGMRAPMGVKVRAQSLAQLDDVGQQIERLLKEVPGVEPAAVLADRVVGKPYLEIHIDRDAIARYGTSIREVQNVIEIAIGGKTVTMSVEGRERYPIRVRYPRELRDSIEAIGEVLVPTRAGARVPLAQLADIRFTRGPMVIKSEDTFLVGYVLFDRKSGEAEVDVVERAREHLDAARERGELTLPSGSSYVFAGNYENQVRSERTLMVVLPLSLVIIFLILYLQFRRVSTTLVVFSGILVAWAGGFAMLWIYGQPWFLDFDLFGTSMRGLFNAGSFNLSVAVWVGFIALFGIATDNGVVISTYLEQSAAERSPGTSGELREATVEAAMRRIRPCLMTTATTILALLPVITSSGRGADVMIPMALPSLGGMAFALMTLFVVPVAWCGWAELRLWARQSVADGR